MAAPYFLTFRAIALTLRAGLHSLRSSFFMSPCLCGSGRIWQFDDFFQTDPLPRRKKYSARKSRVTLFTGGHACETLVRRGSAPRETSDKKFSKQRKNIFKKNKKISLTR